MATIILSILILEQQESSPINESKGESCEDCQTACPVKRTIFTRITTEKIPSCINNSGVLQY